MEVSAIMNIYDLAANRKGKRNTEAQAKQNQEIKETDVIPTVSVVAKHSAVSGVREISSENLKEEEVREDAINGRLVDIVT